MAESTKKAPQERRRSLAAEPFEELDAEAKGQGETLKKAALAAAVTAGAGALAGAAKALLDKRKAHESRPSSDAAENESDESDDAQADEPEASATAPEPAVVDELDDEDAEEGDDDSGDELDEPDETEEDDDGDLDDAAEARSDASEVVSRAREQFEHLLGREPESISRIERTNGHWSVTLEAVELRRIPDSTDVLASYELVLDDDGNVARMARKGRYVRSQGDTA
jgi:gas vesicle protein GvpO